MNNRELYGQVGELHRRCRAERGITRHDLAAQMGVTPYWLSLVESAELRRGRAMCPSSWQAKRCCASARCWAWICAC